jgi:pentatricopeptide repeat protein
MLPVDAFLHAIRQFKASGLIQGKPAPELLPFLASGLQYRRLTDHILKSDSPSVIVDALNYGKACTLAPSASTYQHICYQLFLRHEFGVLLHVTDLVQDWTVELLDWRTCALMELALYREMSEMLDRYDELGLKPTQRTFHLLVRGYLRNHDVPAARRCLQTMIRAGYSMGPKTHAIIAASYRSLGMDDKVEEMGLEGLPGLPESTQVGLLNNFLRGHLDNRNMQQAARILSLFEPRSVEVIADVLFGNGTGGGMVSSAHLFARAPVVLDPPPLPNASTFALLIYFSSMRKNFGGALQLLHCMISQGVVPSVEVITGLMHACFTGNRPDLAVELVAGTCTSSATPRSLFDPIYSGTWNEPCFEVHVPGMKPQAEIFNALLLGVLPLYDLDGALQVLRIMEVSNVRCNSRTSQILLQFLERNKSTDPRHLVRVLHAMLAGGITPSPQHIHVIFKSIFRRQKSATRSAGWAAWKHPRKAKRPRPAKMLDTNHQFGGITFPPTKAYKLSGRFFEALERQGFQPNPATYAMRMRYEAVIKLDIKEAARVFEEMLARGMRPNVYHFSAMMEGYALEDDIDSLEATFDLAKRSGVVPNVVLYSIVITAHARERRPRKAMNVFQEMVNRGINPDVPCIDALVGGIVAMGASALGRTTLISLWDCIQPFPDELESMDLLKLADRFRSLHQGPSAKLRHMSHEKQEEVMLKLDKLVEELFWWERKAARALQAPNSSVSS